MRKILWSLMLMLPVVMYGQSYNVLLVPDSLKKNADAIVRFDERIMEIKSPGKAVIKEKHAYTIMNEMGADYARYVSYYDKFTSINSITCTLFDAFGKELRHVKKKDMADESADDNMSLMLDTRYKKQDFYYHTYPFTVEFEEEDVVDGILDFSDWVPLSAPDLSVQNSRYVIIAPKNYLVRYKNLNYTQQPAITEAGDKKMYTWEVKNLKSVQKESNSPAWREIVPCVMFAPSDFEAEGYKGNMSTWQDYGKFLYQLIKGRDVLPDNIKSKVHALTDGIQDERQKVYILYDFLQKNSRYISIQLGIGGLQPFDATYVATKRYGDCKALSNYMIALLHEAGIKGKYVEIRAGEHQPQMIQDFPSFQSNHVIACVPMKTDTIWLECTSQTVSPGFMGSFTGDRKAIIIDEEGGHIVSTPSYQAKDNVQSRSVMASITDDGSLDAKVNTRFTGVSQELPHDLIYEVSKEWREKYLNRAINLPTYEVDKSEYEEQRSTIPSVKEYLHITSPGYASVTGKRLFVTPNLFNKTNTKYSADSVRKYDIVFEKSYRTIDSITIQLPPGYKPEAMPQDVTLNSRFGKYQANVKMEGDKLQYYRYEERWSERFPSTDYSDLVKFQDQVYKADRSRVVLVKKE